MFAYFDNLISNLKRKQNPDSSETLPEPLAATADVVASSPDSKNPSKSLSTLTTLDIANVGNQNLNSSEDFTGTPEIFLDRQFLLDSSQGDYCHDVSFSECDTSSSVNMSRRSSSTSTGTGISSNDHNLDLDSNPSESELQNHRNGQSLLYCQLPNEKSFRQSEDGAMESSAKRLFMLERNQILSRNSPGVRARVSYCSGDSSESGDDSDHFFDCQDHEPDCGQTALGSLFQNHRLLEHNSDSRESFSESG